TGDFATVGTGERHHHQLNEAQVDQRPSHAEGHRKAVDRGDVAGDQQSDDRTRPHAALPNSLQKFETHVAASRQGRLDSFSSSWTRLTMRQVSRPPAAKPRTKPMMLKTILVLSQRSVAIPMKKPTRGETIRRVGIARRSPAERR